MKKNNKSVARKSTKSTAPVKPSPAAFSKLLDAVDAERKAILKRIEWVRGINFGNRTLGVGYLDGKLVNVELDEFSKPYVEPVSLSAAVVVYHTVNPSKAMDFLISFLDQVDWKEGTPARALDRFKQSCGRSFGDSNGAGLMATAAALMSHDGNFPAKIVRHGEASGRWIRDLNPRLRSQVRKILGEK